MEFQAVIMAGGRGSRMTDLTASVPKALLPVGNRPVIWYPVNMLEKAGFESVIIITFESVKRDLIQALQSVSELSIRLDIVTIPSDDDWGTAESLRFIRDKIKTDVLVVSCDLITDVELHLLADVRRTYDASLTVLLHAMAEQSTEGVSVPGTKSKRKTEQRDIVGLDEKGGRILLLAAEADIDEALSVRKSVLRRYPFIQVKTRLMDAHMYILKKWVIDFLADNKVGSSYSTVKGELIPHLVKKQFSRRKTNQEVPTEPDSLEPLDIEDTEDIFNYDKEDDMTKKVRTMSSWNEHTGAMSDYFQEGDTLRCHTYVMDSGFCIRANTMAAYCEANRQIPQQKQLLGDDPLFHSTATIKAKSQVGQDSMVGEGSSVGEKVSIKRSIIGKHCTVGDKVKIINSVLMNHVTIGEGCTIQGSVICGDTHIGESIEMKDCLVGSSQKLSPKAKYSNEVIGDADRMMEI
ncbi:translation initiation factor eIF2B subunit gamma-like [Asterias amurensis]|uniref:translation initiation factor eIF2B subunit gamma-like n=1 Tax=Asterias amurensis TaxID=7602 RepID=UPI003AB60B73